MSSVTIPSPSPSSIAALLRADTPALPPRSDRSASAAQSTDSTGSDRGPATTVELSDKVKGILAQAKADQSVADRLQAFVAHRHQGGSSHNAKIDSSQQTNSDSKTDIDKVFQKLAGQNTQVTVQATDAAPPEAPVEPTISFHNELQAAGFSVSATADAQHGSFTVTINGPNGLSGVDKRFSPSFGWSGFSGLGGLSLGSYETGNVEYISFTQAEAAAESITTSSNAGTISASAAEAHSSSVTLAIDFTTGSISIEQSETTAASVSAQIGQPRPSFSKFA